MLLILDLSCQTLKGILVNLGKEYIKGTPLRQDYLETALSWVSEGSIEKYMGEHQHDTNANKLWLHYQKVISWAKSLYPTVRKELKGVDWGSLYEEHKEASLDPDELEVKVKTLMMDDDVTKKSGIYTYLLSGDEKVLNVRAFSQNIKQKVFIKQEGVCKACHEDFLLNAMEADHIDPWSTGGKTNEDNCQMLCKPCNRRKGAK